MNLDPRQLTLLAIAAAVPAVAFLTNRSRSVLPWVGFTLSVQIFDTTVLTNLPAGRLVGLLFLPSAIVTARRWMKLAPARAWMINFSYMAILGCIFGFLMPWPDISGVRPISLRAEGRTVIFLVRSLSDLSLTVFVMTQITRPGAFEELRKWVVRGAAVSSAFGFVTLATQIDFYSLITGMRLYAATDPRPRGLAFEPRGLGLACAHGLILILAKQTRTSREWALLLLIAGGLAVSASASALAAFLAALTVLVLIGSVRTRLALAGGAVICTLLGAVLVGLFPSVAERSEHEVRVRIEGRGVVESNNPANALEAMALHMDVFDSAASLFLIRHPLYAVIGTGPGLVTLPASVHIPEGVYSEVFPVIDNPPSLGILRELANTGLLGVATWMFQVLVIFAAGRRLRGHGGLPFPPRTATIAFMAGAALYALQVGPSPFWAVFLGIGWAIADVAIAKRSRPSRHSEVELAEARSGAHPAQTGGDLAATPA
jgi:hypothetical protein